MVVEPYDRHMKHFKSIVVESVLIRVDLLEIVILVNCRHDIQVVMRSVRVRSFLRYIIKLFISVEFGQYRFRMLFFYCLDVGDLSKVQFVDFVTDIQCFNMTLHHQSRKYVLVSMAANVEVAWDLLDCERPYQSTAVTFIKCLFG